MPIHYFKITRQARGTEEKWHLARPGLCVSVTALLTSMMAGVSHAQSGTLDPAFGTNGRVLTTFTTSGNAGSSDEAFAVVIQQSDGKILAAGSTNAPVPNDDPGNFALVRYNPDGSHDTSFGLFGGVITNFRTDVPTNDPNDPSQNSADQARALVIQPDGKIVVGGISSAPNGDSNFALVRYNPDGSVDTAFGGNSIFPGTTLLDFGDGSTDELRALALQPDGKIVAAGFSTHPPTPNADGNFALVRFNPDGSIDPSFGDNSIFPGTVLTDFGNESFEGANTVAVLPDGQIVAAGMTGPTSGCEQAFGLVRYSANGVPDTNFGVNNRVVTCVRGTRAEVKALIVQPDGQIVAVGRTNGPDDDGADDFNFALARYNSDGTLDPTFNATSLNPGLSITNFDERALGDGTIERSFDEARAAAIQADGRIVAAGFSDAPLGVNNTNFALVRYDLSGVAITNFGTNNRVLTDLENTTGDQVANSSTDRANAIAIQPDGLIVVVGGSDAPVANADFNFALVRYLP